MAAFDSEARGPMAAFGEPQAAQQLSQPSSQVSDQSPLAAPILPRATCVHMPLAGPMMPGRPIPTFTEHVFKYISSEDCAPRTLVLRECLEEGKADIRFLAPHSFGQHHGTWWEDEGKAMLFVQFNSRWPSEKDLHAIELRAAYPPGCWFGHDDNGAIVKLERLYSTALFFSPVQQWLLMPPL